MHLFRNKLIALALVLPITLAGQAPPRIVTTSFQVPFTDTVFVSSTSEWVALSGRIHILAEVTQPSASCNPCHDVPLTVHTNLDGVSGVGRATGRRYQAVGEFTTGGSLTAPGQFEFRGEYQLHAAGATAVEYGLLVEILARIIVTAAQEGGDQRSQVAVIEAEIGGRVD